MGKDLEEIRAMPFPDYRSWMLYYSVEPFGWQDEEYRTGSVVAAVYNSTAAKKKDIRPLHDFMRDPEKHILNAFENARKKEEQEDRYHDMTDEQKKEFAMKNFRKLLSSKG